MRSFLERLTSRKFLMALLAAAAAFIKAYYPDFPVESLYALVAACLGYIAVEGAIDAVSQLGKWLAENRASATKS